MRRIYILLCALIATACSAPEQEASNGRIKIVATTGMVADLARNIGGDRVEVIGLMGPGVDPHYYKASQGDLARITDADIVLFNGLFLEGKMEDIFAKMARSKKVVAVAGGVDEKNLRRPPEFLGHFDPHIWFDVSLWAQTVEVAVASLSELDPEGAEVYRRNGEQYRARLDALHQWVIEQVGQISEQQRVLITAHDAFGYFGLAYGFEVVGLQGISTVAEYGVNDVTQLVDRIVERQVKAIFVESSVPVRSIEAVRQGCLNRGFEVVIGGTLYSDAMGGAGSGADSYVGMVESNVNTIVGALR
ncbi:MAG: zinc ABC transporter solute-binding protein [Gemmatimonadetes bacterium]|jgi:manganese/zinc/iron transport system substrate-binding protein|nr:zinc ABC transporter solute-binding protein [Gemmatimonadota bacterium]MBT5324919.1 zinc ABC transporter solute-binding protein [Gemmatimonadota bacterium]MBT5451631.1 zinc ABC transporter solute-binding protein [Gemmatimonadota bacterium]MBT6903090.1 zinc ABC transporter solute-binding protein [Gemmatimonadota bacterium]MBT7550326.1 zinc ABC transporter solute-binding protein [Gemmatimonadota bacterium]